MINVSAEGNLAAHELNPFELQYLEIRQKEGRVYTDKELRQLPAIHAGHQHYGEWLIRKASQEKLLNYLSNKRKPLKILDIGCGNGWQSARLATIKDSHVTGLDINLIELKQAARVFQDFDNLNFVYGDIRSGDFSESRYDIILFSASIQYFSPLQEILNVALQHLAPGGEIHITDTNFYSKKAIPGAKSRTEAYYSNMGFPDMAAYYFHHDIKSLVPFRHQILHNPNSLLNKLLNAKNPFYWVCVKG